jgi:hypothetical protein
MVQFLCPCDRVPVGFPDEEIGWMSVVASPSDWNSTYELALRVATAEARYQLVATADAIEHEVRLEVQVLSDLPTIALLHDLLGGSPGRYAWRSAKGREVAWPITDRSS